MRSQAEPVEEQTRSYEEICDHSRKVVGEIDQRRWVVGDDALEIETAYGHHTMDDFARDIGMNKSTIKGWKRVAEFYDKSIRRNLLEAFPNLTYTYFKDAIRAGDLKAALDWLEKVSAEGWTADQAAHEMTERIGDSEGGKSTIPGMIENIYTHDGKCMIVMSIGQDDEQYIRDAHEISIRVKA